MWFFTYISIQLKWLDISARMMIGTSRIPCWHCTCVLFTISATYTDYYFACRKYMTQLITGYLPSVILQIFLYTVPPTMMFFSTLEGPISHSERKKSACCKVLYFTIWNVFFVNVLSGSAISQLNALSSPKDIPMQLAKAVPVQVNDMFVYYMCIINCVIDVRCLHYID